MPKADLETLFRSASGGDRKIACETVLLQSQLPPQFGKTDLVVEIPDFPPESFQVPADEWFDRNAALVRKTSTKGIHFNSQFPGPKSNSSSQRSTIKSKASILGLPKLPDSGQLCRTIGKNCRPPSICVAAKRAGRRPGAEPSSPKVSCLGRVRSKNRSRRCRSRRESAPEAKKPAKKKSGFLAPIMGILRLGGRRERRRAAGSDGMASAEPSARGATEVGGVWRSLAVETEAAPDPPALGGMKRFASGRRTPSWGGDEVEIRHGGHAPEL